VKQAFDANGISIPYPHQVEISKPHRDGGRSKPPRLLTEDDGTAG
jgi:small-conductance mechanosensitive channel